MKNVGHMSGSSLRMSLVRATFLGALFLFISAGMWAQTLSATITGSTTVCRDALSPSVTFTGSGGTAPYTFTYNINGGGTLEVVSDDVSGIATVSVPTDVAGDFVYTLISVDDDFSEPEPASGSVTVTVNALPVVAFPGTLSSQCISSTTYALTGGTPAGGTYSGTGVTGSNFDASVAGVGVHTLTYTYTDVTTGCTNSATNSITVNALPIVNAGTDASIHNGTNTLLQGSVSGEGTFAYLWSPSDRVVSPATLTTQTTNLSLSVVFTLTATNLTTGCLASDNVTVTVTGSALSVSAQATDNLICSGEMVQLSAVASGGSGTYTYSWTSDPSGFTSDLLNPAATPSTTTTYYVTVNDGFNSTVGQTTIVVNPLPMAIAGSDRSIFQGQSTQIGTTSNTGSTYLWTSNPVGFTSIEANPTVIPPVTTIYTLTETITSTGCSNSHSVAVTVNSLPASFIPVWWPGNGLDHMNFYVSTATLDNSDLQPGDIVGVFDGNLCVGVGVLTEVLTGSNLLPIVVSRDDSFTPEIDGYTLGNTATYRIWDAGDSREYYYTDATYLSGTSIFAVGATTSLNIAGVRPVTQTINLAAGWNVLSFTVMPDNRSMLSVVQPLIDNGTLVKVMNEGGTALELIGITWYNFIGNALVTEGYKVRVSANTSLAITGRPVASPLDIPLLAGWNIISYPFPASQTALAVFDPLIDAGTLVKVQNETGVALEYILGFGWIDNIKTIVSGEGYKVRTNASTTLSLTDDMGTNLKGAYSIDLPTHFHPVYEGNGLDHMNIYYLRSVIEDDGLIPGDEIGVFDGDLCVGYGIIDNSDQQYVSIVASFDDPSTLTQDGFVEGHPINLRIWSQKLGREMKINQLTVVEGSSKQYVKNGTSILSGSFSMQNSTLLREAFPNPTSDRTTFPFSLAKNDHVSLEIINSLGVVVRTLINEKRPSGENLIEWDNCSTSGVRLMPGLYLYRLETSDGSFTKQLVIQR